MFAVMSGTEVRSWAAASRVRRSRRSSPVAGLASRCSSRARSPPEHPGATPARCCTRPSRRWRRCSALGRVVRRARRATSAGRRARSSCSRARRRSSRAGAKGAAIAAQGVRTSGLDGDELRAAFPAFGPAVLGGRCSRASGPSTPSSPPARSPRPRGRRAPDPQVRVAAVEGGGLLTDEGRVAADAVVVATGPWLADLASRRVQCGARVAAADRPARRAVDRRGGLLARPGRARPARAGRRWRRSPRGRDGRGRVRAHLPAAGRDALLGASLSTSLRDAVEGTTCRGASRSAWRRRPGLSAGVVRAWSGLRPMTPDGLPLAGPAGPDGRLGPRRPRLARHAGRARHRRVARGGHARRARAADLAALRPPLRPGRFA